MAYIPPHKRLSLDKDRPPPVAESIRPLFQKNLSLNTRNKSGKIVYSKSCISRWFAVGLSDNDEFQSHVRLEPVSAECFKHQSGGKSLILVNTNVNEEIIELSKYMRSPWLTIASKVEHDLFSSLEILRKQMSYHGFEKVKPALVARFGKIRFHGPSVSLENLQQNQVNKTLLRQSKRSFYTTIPSLYMKNIQDQVVQKIGIDFEEEKDIYRVMLSDNTRTDSTVLCKCSLNADKRLMFYKVELNQVRQMVADISCLDKNLDLRLMLCSKRILTADLTEDEIYSIKELVSSAVLDSDVKGGLRWPVGKTSCGDRFSVVGVWHTVTRAYSSPSLRLKVRHADRYDFRKGFGEAGKEVHMKLKGIVSEFLEQGAQNESVSNMLKSSLMLIWDNFLCCETFLT
ncbi:uncharacterized protein LOC126671671 isoform X2 [Mercurialis annua]|uniref:uncharacterized protein LOC126671671 isoform X2 n=1 Tax=Mercurialis annua TaxID=3986 RepID=UPI0024AE3AE2|nr:uncharacterized protein LOC126671671 isoform X2 [Mercurialis annua]